MPDPIFIKKYDPEWPNEFRRLAHALRTGESIQVQNRKDRLRTSGKWHRFNTTLSSGRKMVIDELVIDQKYRGQGHGTRFIEHCIEMAKEQALDSIMFLVPFVSNSWNHYGEIVEVDILPFSNTSFPDLMKYILMVRRHPAAYYEKGKGSYIRYCSILTS